MDLVGVLQGMDDQALGRLLRLRPDLVAAPAPGDFGALAERAGSAASIQQALDGLDRFALEVSQASCLLADGFVAGEVTALFGGEPNCPPGPLHAALDRLAERVLVLRAGSGGLEVLPALRRLMHHPFALGRPFAELCSVGQAGMAGLEKALGLLGLPRKQPGERKADLIARLAGALADRAVLAGVLASAPPGTADLVGETASSRPVCDVSTYYGEAARRQDPRHWLLERALLMRVERWQAEMPREVGVALRGGQAGVTPHPFRPAVGSRRPAPDLVASSAAAVAGAALRSVEALLALWAASPPGRLKTGGVGVRDLGRAAKACGLPEADAAVLVEVAAAAGLLGFDRQGRAVPTADYDTWTRGDPAGRWLRLATGWLGAQCLPSLAGGRDRDDKPIPCLLALRSTAPPLIRRLVLAILAGPLAGAAAETRSLAEGLEWDGPAHWYRAPASPEVLVGWVQREAELLGVTGEGALSPWGAHLVAARFDQARAEADAALGADGTTVTFQADLTAVAAGPLAAGVAAELALLADVESRGAATVWRISAGSLARAFDAGRTADGIVAFLEDHAARGVPQPLAYLVGDTARRHGGVRAGSVSSYVRSDDPAVMAELGGSRRLARLDLRVVGPTVAVSSAPASQLVAALREAGFLAVEESADGGLVVAAPPSHRVEKPPPARKGLASRLAGPDKPSAMSPADTAFAWVTPGAEALVAISDPAPLLAAWRAAPETANRRKPPARPAHPDDRFATLILPGHPGWDDVEEDFDESEGSDEGDEIDLARSAIQALLAEAEPIGPAGRLDLLDTARREESLVLISYLHPRTGPVSDVFAVLGVMGDTAHVLGSDDEERLIDVGWILSLADLRERPRRGGRR